MDALKVFVDQLFKNFEKQPGWIPLVLLSYIAVPFFRLPDHAASVFHHPELKAMPAAVLAVVLTYAFYLLGDALDKVVFKRKSSDGNLVDRFKPHWLQDARRKAQDAFGVCGGIYPHH